MNALIFIKGAVTALCAVVVAWFGWGAYMTVSTPEPAYEVVLTLPNDIEVRDYEAQTWISAPAGGDNSSFRILASYIFGDNVQNQKVAMTAPVISDEAMSFILPEGMDIETAPTPNGQPIEFTEVPPRSVATIRFSGYTTTDRVVEKTRLLREALALAGVETTGRPFLMRYNDPWTPPMMRRNEVGIVVR